MFFFLPLAVIVAPCAVAAAAAPPADTPARPAASGSSLTPEQVAAMGALDVMLAGFETLFAKIADADMKSATRFFLDDFKGRRDALRKNFDPSAYNDLKLEIYHDYQRTALWLQPLRTPPRSDEPTRTDPSRAGRMLLQSLEWQLRDLAARVRRRPAGPSREAGERAIAAILARHEALQRNFTKVGYDDLLAQMQALAN